MAKKFKRTQIAAVREVLCSLMPGTFAPKGMPKKPLAIGIRETVIKRVLDAHPEISIGLICATIADYVRGIRYQQALVEGAERVDADGLPSGSVDQASAAAAIGEVNRIHGVMREQRRMRELNKQEQVSAIDTAGIDQAVKLSPPRQYILDQIQKWKVKAHDAQMIDDWRRSKEEQDAANEQVKIWEFELKAFDAAVELHAESVKLAATATRAEISKLKAMQEAGPSLLKASEMLKATAPSGEAQS